MSYDPNFPPYLDDAVSYILNQHRGRAAAIGRMRLVRLVNANGFHAHERVVRQTISHLRKQGELICSMPGEGGGYYTASSMKEFREFVDQEYRAKINDMHETLSAMQRAAEHKFGRLSPQKQIALDLP